jgi:hypothetical protein
MPPQALAEDAVFAVDSAQEAVPPPPLVPPQAATTNVATTARPRRRVRLPNLMLRLPLQ